MLGITHAQASGQRGFTLIEMSIVLVIIGLIIGGILKGQEIIESSRQKNVITQIDSVRAAINTFADKYNALPGDYSLAASRIQGGLVDGDDSGIVGSVGTNVAGLDALLGIAGENVHFWNHLAAAELLSGTTIGTATGGFGDVNALPSVAVPGAGMTMAYGNHDRGNVSPRQTHWGRIHKNPAAGPANDAASGAFSGKRMFEIDLKVDDANGSNGAVRIAADANTNCTSDLTGAYDALSNEQECAVYYELLQ